ncbi:MAG TPA: hydrophobe/amphiphile efflux-1 family RND transporter, partial [Succinivibrionaceae bacterium]|nr:hydrophobe/amphiphile efflux-1 family RND transporter [Succinivibrionaceae bacterium]
YAMTSFDPRYPQYKVTVDAAKCLRMNVSPTDVLSVVSGYIGSSYSSNINLYSKLYKVMVQASPEFTKDLSSFSNMFVKSSNGDMLPVRQFLILDKVYGPEELKRFNLFNSIAVNAAPAPGYSSGEAIAAVEATAKEVLPMGFGYEYDGMTREEASTGSSTIVVYTMCLIFVFLILSSLYESVLIPFAVLLSVPSAITGAFIFANLMGIENNIYMQTGIIMLMGLIAKTAILLTEFASEKRREGMSIAQASLTAAKERFRPILMTSICMIVGLMPLVLAHGVGANGNRSLGVGVVGGMLVGIICLLITTPVFFIVIQYIQEKLIAKFKLGSYRNQ